MNQEAPAESTRRIIATAEDMIASIELEAIDFFSFEAKRVPDRDVGSEAVFGMQLSPAIGSSGRTFRVAVTASLEGPDADFEVGLALMYSFKEPVAIEDPSMVRDFMGASTVVSAGPYIREALQSFAVRIGAAIPRPGLIRPMELFRTDEGPESALDVFDDGVVTASL